MDNLETIVEMRKTLNAIKESITPYSNIKEHQRYFDNLLHYKKILTSYVSHSVDDIEYESNMTYNKIRDYFIQIELNNKKLIDGTSG
jgi:uncharacterized protein YaaR (DUF327 family)